MCIFSTTLFTDFRQSQSRYGLETRPTSLFYIFVRVYAELCTVKAMNFWYNEAFNRTIEILVSKISKDLCTVKPAQHKMIAHYKRFEVRQVSRPCVD